MAVVVTKSASITNWDATPVFIPTTGEGADGPQRVANDSVSAANGDTGAAGQIPAASLYRFCRIPTNAKVKKVLLNTTGITVGTADIDVVFSDSLTDGTQPAFSQLANPVVLITAGADNKLFAAATTLVAPITQKDVTLAQAGGSFTLAHMNIPLWQVLVNIGATQFVSDPGGFFDIGLKLVTSITTAGTIGIEVDYVE